MGDRDTEVVRTYGQYCPIARGAEIFAERWTPLIIRNLHLGCDTFGAILEGAPGLSHTLLAQRLKQLEHLRIVESVPKPQGRGHRYQLTESGHELFGVCETLGAWGARWLEIAPENLDPYVALWSMCNALRPERLPEQRVVIRFDFTGFRPHERYWLLLEHGETEICKIYPGLDEDLYITAEAEAFVKWHAGQLTWAHALRDSRIRLDGPSWLIRAFPTWNARSMFAHIKPTSGAATPNRVGAPARGDASLRREGPTDRASTDHSPTPSHAGSPPTGPGSVWTAAVAES